MYDTLAARSTQDEPSDPTSTPYRHVDHELLWRIIPSAVSGEKLISNLSYTHLEQLVAIEAPLKRAFYEIECIRGGWSVRALKRQISSLYFERSGMSLDKDKLSAMANETAEHTEPKLSIRDPYIFEFLGLKPKEAVVNAIYHRSYEIREPVEIRISREDLVVLSFPGPHRSIRLEDLKKGKAVSRRYRNRRIGEFLKELDLTEGRSTGISKIIKSMAANGSPAPEFETDEERSYFLIRLPVHEKAANWEGLLPEVGSEKGSEKTSGKILELIQRTPSITVGELAMTLGFSSRAVEKQVAKLKDSGRIRREGSDRDGTWVVLDLAASGQQTTPQFEVIPDKTGSVKTTQETSVKTSVKILEILRRSPELTLGDVAEEIGVTRRAVEMGSSKLVKEGRLKYIGPQKGGHWQVSENS